MSTNMQRAQDLLFGKDGLGATNFKMYPGTNREASSDEIAEEIANAIEKIAEGQATIVTY
jgi:hypothetical protein